MKSKPNKALAVNDPHNTRLLELFRNKGAFLSFLGDCVKPKWFDSLDTDSLKRSSTSFILQDFSKKEADIVYEATINNGRQKVILYVLLELQSRVDYRMPYRLLLYIVEVLRHFYNSSDVKARKRKNFKFPAVIPIVFFSGKRKWTVPTSLREMFDGHKRFDGQLLNFDYTLVDAKGYDDNSVKDFNSRLLKIMMMFEKAENIAELHDIIKKYENDIERLDDEEVRIISVAVGILDSLYDADGTSKLIETLKVKKAEGVSGMLSNLIANEKKREKEWFRQALIETAKRYLEMGLTIEQVAEGSCLTVEEVEKIKNDLNISFS